MDGRPGGEAGAVRRHARLDVHYVFETQLENLQNADRFYYLERLDGLNLLSQLEGNSFAELIQRNTTAEGMAAGRLRASGLRVQPGENLPGPGNTIVDDPTTAFDEPELVDER